MAVTDDDIATAYAEAQKYAARRSRRRRREFGDLIHDAAADAVVRARDHFDAARAGAGGFASFCAAAVRQFVRRACDVARKKEAARKTAPLARVTLSDEEWGDVAGKPNRPCK
jgi:hypothetical protein